MQLATMNLTNDGVLQAARSHLREQSWRQADAVAVRWLQRQPNSGEAAAVRGLVSLANARLDLAQDFLQSAVSLDPHSGFAYFALAQLYLSQTKASEAESCLRRALALAPDEFEASCVLSNLLADRGDVVGAEALLRAALALAPDNATVHFVLAQLVLRSGDWEQATALVETGVALAPKLTVGWVLSALLSSQQGHWREARQFAEQALLLEPENPNYLAEMARISLLCATQTDVEPAVRASILAEAEQAARQAMVLAPKDSAAPFFLGGVLRALGRTDEALSVQAGLVKLSPQDPAPVLEIALTQLDAGNMNAAHLAVAHALRLAPELPQAHLIQSHVFLLEGNLGAAFAAQDRAHHLVNGAIEVMPAPLSRTATEEKTILLLAPSMLQALLYARYVPMLAQMGATVSIATDPHVHGLLRSVDGLHELLSLDVEHQGYSHVEPMARLPALFATHADSVPWSGPYCSSDADDLVHLKGLFASLPAWRVGLNLGAAPEAALATVLGQVFRELGVTVVLLAPLDCLESVFDGVTIESAENANTAQLAALVQALDCVITIDSLLAHIAGVMGATCHLLLPVQHDPIWGSAGELTAWYPQTHLYRQSRQEDWLPTMAALQARLAQSAIQEAS
jgi:tetratricopeptide (TPR) repeat protein